MKKDNKLIIFDIDGTLTDYNEFVDSVAAPYFKKKLNIDESNKNALEIEDVFDFISCFKREDYPEEVAKMEAYKAVKRFWRSLNSLKFSPFGRFRKGVPECIRYLQSSGYQLEIHTTRKGAQLRAATRLQFIFNGVNIKQIKIFFHNSDEEKVEGICNRKPIIVFDDKPSVIEKLLEEGISVCCVKGRHNKNITQNAENEKIAFIDEFSIKRMKDLFTEEPFSVEMAERILKEIDMCRADERNAQSMQLQVISTAGTVLGVIMGASFFGGDGLGRLSVNLWILSMLCDFIFIATFSFMTSLGTQNVLRYHYLRDLEVEYNKLKCGTGKPFVDWMRAVSPITTRNITHIKSFYTLMDFLSNMGAAIFAAFFCAGVTWFMYHEAINSVVDYVQRTIITGAFILVIAVVVGELLVMFVGSAKSEAMFRWSKDLADKKMREKIIDKDCSENSEDENEER